MKWRMSSKRHQKAFTALAAGMLVTTTKQNTPAGSSKQDLREKLRKQQSLQDQLENVYGVSYHLYFWPGMENKHKSCAELPFF